VTDLLTLDGITVQFGGLKAVDAVSLRVPVGERRAIIGPNGAGKTTLFNAITGMIRPTQGRVTFQGADVTKAGVHVRARAGMSRTFQITNLFPNLTVAENMTLALNGISPRKFSLLGSDALGEAETSRIDRALRLSRLGEQRGSPVKALSYGEQRQLELAMALAAEPKLLLLDEPAAGLSPAERVMVADIIRALPRDLTLVLIEHDMDLVLQLVDYVTVLNNGTLLVEAPPAEIRGHPEVQDVYLGKARQHA
jgi:branched-chain amino acid transport system ATP-binding protein